MNEKRGNTGEPKLTDILAVADNTGLSKQRVKNIIEEVNETVKFLYICK